MPTSSETRWAMDSLPGEIDRRRYLSTLAAVAGVTTTAGCFMWDQTGATDVILYSLAADSSTVSVTITDTDATEPHTSRTLEVSPGATVNPVNDGKLPTNTGYTVDVIVEAGVSKTFDWENPTLDLAPLYVIIEDPQNIKFAYNAG